MINLPHDVSAETSVVASIMLDSQALDDVRDVITGRDFYSPGLRKIYQTCCDLAQDGMRPDEITVTNRLRERKWLESVGGASYVSSLMDQLPDVANCRSYAKIIKDKSIKRQIIEVSQKALTSASEDVGNSNSILADALGGLYGVSDGSAGTIEVMGRVVDREVQRAEEAGIEGHQMLGPQTGFRQLDNLLVALQPGNVYVLGATTSSGKSAMADQISDYSATGGYTTAMFLLESTKEQRARRMLARRANVHIKQILTGMLSENSKDRLRKARRQIAELPLHIDDKRGLSAIDIGVRARRIQSRHGLGLVVIDYLQLMRPTRGRGSYEETTSIIHDINNLAGDLNVPILALSQLKRIQGPDGTSREPSPNDFRNSGAIEEDAFAIMLLHRPDRHGEMTLGELHLAKHRDGATGTMGLKYHGPTLRWIDPTEEER